MTRFINSLSMVDKNDLLGFIGLMLFGVATYIWIALDMMGR